MRKSWKASVFAVGLWGLMGTPLQADVNVGEKAPDLTLSDIEGRSHTLSHYQNKFIILEWTNYDCPFVQKHYKSGNMQKLQKEYTAQGVVWLSINSSAPGKQGHYSPEDWKQLTQEKAAVPTAVLLDTDGAVGHKYVAKATPHMFIINPDGVLIYQGAIDSIPSTDLADIPRAQNYVRMALNEAMAGKAVSIPATQSYGCSVKY
jgi:peroxiredoxin